MSVSAEAAAVAIHPAKLELAERIAGYTAVPTQALKSVVQKVFMRLEDVAGRKLDASLRERVWSKLSEGPLQTLKGRFLSIFCKIVFGGFKDAQVEAMLKEHKAAGYVSSPIYHASIEAAYLIGAEAITISVRQKAQSMIPELIPQIVQAVKEEGIVFPESEGDAGSASQ